MHRRILNPGIACTAGTQRACDVIAVGLQDAAAAEPSSAAAAAVPPRGTTRRVFLCFARAVPIVIERL
jgi:hypothetical protein